MKKRFVIYLLMLTALIATGCMKSDGKREKVPKDLYVTVILTDGEGYTIKSQNPMKVSPGGTASFDIEVNPEYIIDSVGGGAVYSDGVVKLENINYPTTLNLSSRPRVKYTYQTMYDTRYGTLTSSVGEKTVFEGTEVTLTAVPAKGSMFLGFSTGGYLKNGGTIVSYSTEFTFTVSSDVRYYANYAQTGSKIVIYDANGGSVRNSSMNLIYVEIAGSHYLCPNTLFDNSSIIRDGYVLYGYNTKPDGSGRYYGLGWNVVMPETGIENLYAQWMKATDASQFSYKIVNSKVQINRYTGNEETVIIPETIEGKPVATINAGAFTNCSFKTLVFSRNIQMVADKSIVNCSKFTTLYFSDSVLSITDSFIQNCPNFSKLYMNAVQAPRYMTSRNGNYQIKFERLITAPGKKLVITAGSNCAYGVISEQLMSGLNNEYSVVNYGCNASTCADFYIEVVSHFINNGDILLHAPENSSYQWGYNEINTTLWQIFEGAYDAFSYVDIRNYIKIFSSFSSFNSSRQSRSVNTYEQYSSETVNIYGDFIKDKIGQVYTPGGQGFTVSIITSGYNKYLNRVLDMVTSAGGKCYLSFAVRYAPKVSTDQTEYVNAAKTNIHATVISAPGDYMFDVKYFYNSDYHLNTAGAVIRTNLLIRDIKAQFAKEK